MALANLLRTALRGVLANRLRAALTTLGVIIGAASVIVMLALGNGARTAVEANFRSLGADEVKITERRTLQSGQWVPAGQTLVYEDGLHLLDAVPQVAWADLEVAGTARVRYGRNIAQLTFLGTTANGLRTVLAEGQVQPAHWAGGRALTPADFIAAGRFLSPAEVLGGDEVCLLGWQTAQDLFEGDDPLGATVWVNRRPCLVIGVVAQLETTDPAQRYTSRVNDALYLPISTAVRDFFDRPPAVTIDAHVQDTGQIDQAKFQIAQYLRQRHHIESGEDGLPQDDFDLTTRSDVLGAQLAAASTFALLLAAMAVVSLAVGGIGIMNVMLVSVTERTREIGIRLAVGAEPGDIVRQFLVEAVLISAAGGVLGIVVGILTIPLAARLNQGVALLAPGSLPLALAVALLTGIVFGLYPALRAARLNPTDALHYE